MRQRWPRIYVAQPFTGLSQEEAEWVRRVSLVIADVAKRESYNVYLPSLSSDCTPEGHPETSRYVYESERRRVCDSELLVAISVAGSTGLGRMLEVADQNLIPALCVHRRYAPHSAVGYAFHIDVPAIEAGTPDDVRDSLAKYLRDRRRQLAFRQLRWPRRREPPLFARRVRAERERLGWSRSDLARRMGVDPSSIESIEEGHLYVSPYILRVIASTLEIDSWMLQQPEQALKRGSKQDEEERILQFFRQHDEGMQRFERFGEAYENRRRPGDPLPTREELWSLYSELFLREG